MKYHPTIDWASQPLYECKILKIDWLYLEISIQPSLRHPTMVKTDMSDLRNSIQPLTEPANHWNNTIIISLRLSREPYIVERNGCHFWSHLTTSWMLMLDTSHYREIIKVRNSKWTCPIWAIPSNHWLSQPTIGAKSLYECKILKIDWLYLEISIQPSLRHPTMVKTDMSDLRNSIQP